MIKYDELFYSITVPVDALNHTGPEPEGPFIGWKDLCTQFNFTDIDCEDDTSDTYDEEECFKIANGAIPWPGPQCFTG